MNRLFNTLRGFVEKHAERETPRRDRPAYQPPDDALPGFENRIEVLCRFAERAAAYEDELLQQLDQVGDDLTNLQQAVEMALDAGKDRDALEYLRLAVRMRPQFTMLERELKVFKAVADDLLGRVTLLMDNMGQAQQFAQRASISPAATRLLDQTLNKLTRYFSMLEKVTTARHRELKQRLAQQMLHVVDDAQLDFELAQLVLNRRRALGAGSSETAR